VLAVGAAMVADVAHAPDVKPKAKIFISYSRKDMVFADRLEAALKARGFEPLIDRTEIYAFEDWWKRIETLIGAADTVVFVLSPDSISSDVALKEIARAASLNKRFAPIVYRQVEDAAVPEALQRLNFIFFNDPDRFEPSADQLAAALQTDIAWIRKHTEFGEMARRWSAAGQPSGLLLRSPALEEGERWIASRPVGAPAPTHETQAFIIGSRKNATKRRSILTFGLAGGLLVAIVLAGLATYAERQAQEQTRIAEQRSAILATSAAQSFTEEGALDQALLLLLNGARAFNDTTVPNEIRIGFTKALQKRERIETRTLFPNMQIFETDDSLLLFNPLTKDIWKLTGSIDPKRLIAGSPNDAGIQTLQQSADRTEYIVLRTNLDVERINSTTGTLRKIGTIPQPPNGQGAPYELLETSITEDGLIVRNFVNGKVTYLVVYDSETGHYIASELTDVLSTVDSILRKSSANGVYALDNDGKVVEIQSSASALTLQKPLLTEWETNYVRYGSCVAGMPDALRAVVIKELSDAINPGGHFNCTGFAGSYLLEVTNSTSAGPERSDILFRPNGKKLYARETLSSVVPGALPDNNFAWVGSFPNSEIFSDDVTAVLRGATAPLDASRKEQLSNDCDRYAESDFDPNRKTDGVPFDKIDIRRAIPACEAAAREYPNSGKITFELGRSYQKGNTFTKATSQFQKVIEQGTSYGGLAQVALGSMYWNGRGAPQDFKQAVALYQLAADQGNAVAEYDLGAAFEHGQGVSQDYAQAISWYRKSAEQQLALAETALGEMYAKGEGVTKDFPQAFAWFRKAADKGNAVALYDLGFLYEKGLGVSKDVGQALAWYQKAATKGQRGAQAKVDELQSQAGVKRDPNDVVVQERSIKEWLGILQNRNTYVLSHDVPDNDASNNEKEQWTLVLNDRQPAFVQSARFIDSAHLIVAEPESGRLVKHDFGAEPSNNLFSTSFDALIGGDKPIDTLHRGTCVGYAFPRSNSAILADGQKITFFTAGAATGSQKHELDIAGTKPLVIGLDKDAYCVDFSADWKRMLIVTGMRVEVYDFEKVLKSGSLAGNEVSTIQLTTSAQPSFFVGSSDDQIIVSDDSSAVQLWKLDPHTMNWTNTEIYRGDNPILYAEPDSTGDLIIMLEDVGSGEVHGFLYSLSGRRIWFDLGYDYKWLGAAFTANSTIAVSEHWKWARFYPLFPLGTFVALAEKELSAECQPPSPKEYRKSPCWPSMYR
jgi:TPR repeat protein